jgi:hypothetical protein
MSQDGDGCHHSLEKLEQLFHICMEEDVRIGPVQIQNEEQSLLVIPLLSWYHDSFDTEPAIEGWGGIPQAKRVVADYKKTKWPEPLSTSNDSIAEFMDELNDVLFDWNDIDVRSNSSILTYSHFLPRIDLLPEKRYLTLPTLHSCVGSTYLEQRLRCYNRRFSAKTHHLHAFGHSHLSWDQTINGVRYIHVPLAYPREWVQRRRSLEIGTMQGVDRFPVCIWEKSTDGENGFPTEWLGGWWSKYYNIMPREPQRNWELAPWAARRFRQLPGGVIEDFDRVKVELEHGLQHPSYWKAGNGSWYNVLNKHSD